MILLPGGGDFFSLIDCLESDGLSGSLPLPMIVALTRAKAVSWKRRCLHVTLLPGGGDGGDSFSFIDGLEIDGLSGSLVLHMIVVLTRTKAESWKRFCRYAILLPSGGACYSRMDGLEIDGLSGSLLLRMIVRI